LFSILSKFVFLLEIEISFPFAKAFIVPLKRGKEIRFNHGTYAFDLLLDDRLADVSYDEKY
jgi:hypothetical protein